MCYAGVAQVCTGYSTLIPREFGDEWLQRAQDVNVRDGNQYRCTEQQHCPK